MAIREASFLGHDLRCPPAAASRGCARGRPPEPPKPRLLDRVRHAIETRRYSRGTEKAYVRWTKRYIFFHGKRHLAEVGGALTITPPERTRYPAGTRRISLPSGSEAFSMVAER